MRTTVFVHTPDHHRFAVGDIVQGPGNREYQVARVTLAGLHLRPAPIGPTILRLLVLSAAVAAAAYATASAVAWLALR